MKALILVGGYGTRLRPLTLSVPKPLIAFCNRTIVEHQIAALVDAGVDHVVLAVAYQPDAMSEALSQLETRFGLRITCSREEEPLGTAGPIRLAESILMEPDDNSCEDRTESDILEESFFVFNSDIICKFPLKEMKAFHELHGREGTVLTTKVADPSKYGVVISDPVTGKIANFVEKPVEFVSDQINAGLYLLKKKAIRRIEPRPASIECEIFPEMARVDELYSMPAAGYWADIGQPNDYLIGMQLYLESLATSPPEGNEESFFVVTRGSHPESATPSDQPGSLSRASSQGGQSHAAFAAGESPFCGSPAAGASPEAKIAPYDAVPRPHPVEPTEAGEFGEIFASENALAKGVGITGCVLIHPTAEVGRGCSIGPNVTIGAGCRIGNGVRMQDCALMEKTKIADYACLSRAIVGWKCSVGRWVRMENLTVLGEDVKIKEECFVNGALILPHKTITKSLYEAGNIIM